jgi:hypothetical protein
MPIHLQRGAVTVVLVTLLAACTATAAPPQRTSESPFGVVCPWSGIDEAKIAWCRVGAGATAFANWPDIEKSPGVYDWTASDNELKHTADPLGLSLLPINVGANGGNAWSVALSRDGRQYTVECAGKSWPGWQTLSLDKYLHSAAGTPAPVYVKVQGTDCQVREVVLDTR